MPRVTITIPEQNAQPYRFQLDRQIVTLGRGSANDIVIESGSVSVHHCEMARVAGGYELRDSGSTNGIKVSGERMAVVPLRSGMSVKIGDVAFDFLLTDEELDALAAERPVQDSPIIREAAEEPVVARAVVPQQAPVVISSSGGGLFAFAFVLFAAAAFFIGLSVRHQKETGGSLLKAMLGDNKPAATAPATPAAAEAEEAPVADPAE